MKNPQRFPNYRQGDVLIFSLQAKYARGMKSIIAEGFKFKDTNVIIEGEISGHKHEVENGKLYEKDNKIIIEAQADCVIKHPEHAPIKLPQGIYEIDIQEEYDEVKHASKVKD